MTVESLRTRVADAVNARRPFVEAAFDRLRADSLDEPGVTRDPFGEGESRAHRHFRQVGETHGFDVWTDLAANSFAALRGEDRSAPSILIGSHLDSVPHGGNFDGAAGVVAGLTAMIALTDLGIRPAVDVATMAIRAEESMWFRTSYVGSRAALGQLPADALAARRIDTGRTLAEHMAECGADVEAVQRREASLSPGTVGAYLEVHIEQAPSLLAADVPLGICTGIPGNFRYPSVRIVGAYDHVGLPRRFRHDALMAAVDIARRLDELWTAHEAEGRPIAVTLGEFGTDPAEHSLTRIPGEARFSLDVRAYDDGQLAALEEALLATVAEVEAVRGVTLELGRRTTAPVGLMAPDLVKGLAEAADSQAIPAIPLGSPGSHDAAAFSAAGVPTAMILVRNANGSHNPHEAMEIDDLLAGIRVLADWIIVNAGPRGGT